MTPTLLIEGMKAIDPNKTFMTAPNLNTPAQAITVAPKREIRVVEDESPAAFMLDTAKFEHCYRLAEAMSRATLLPKHLKGATNEEAKANCFLVVNQAMAWKLNPFLIMGETYEVQGKLGFQGKLIIAVMNTRAGLREKLTFEFNDKKGDDLAVTVSGRFIGEDSPRTVTVSVGQVKTSNQMWTKDPEQKLIYTAAIRWARRYAPEVVMGVMIEEDLEAIKEEAHIASLKQVKSPVFENHPGLPEPDRTTQPIPTTQPEKLKRKRPTLVESPLDAPAPEALTPTPQPETPSVTVPAPNPAPVVASPTPETVDKVIMRRAEAAGITKEQLISYLKAERWMRKEQTDIREVSRMKLELFLDVWDEEPARMIAKIKGESK